MPTDFELLANWRDGDKKAGNELFDRHFESIQRFFRNKVGLERLEDLVQRTFLIMIEKKDDFRGDSSFRTYLFALAHNVLRNAFRENQRKKDRYDFGTVSAHDLGPGQQTMFAKQQDQQILLNALRRIPIDFQVCLELYYWEQMEAKELAEILELPIGTVRSRIRIGKQKLEKAIEELAASTDVASATVTNLEDWARQLRDQILPAQAE